MENQMIHERLQRVKPSMSTAKKTLELQWEGAKKYASNCSRRNWTQSKASHPATSANSKSGAVKVPTRMSDNSADGPVLAVGLVNSEDATAIQE